MTTIARLCLTYCTAFPLQRYGMLGGLALALAGIALLGVSPPVAALTTMLGIVVLAAACLVPIGWVFRALSTPSAHRFAPHARIKMLAAALAVVIAPSVLAGLAAAIVPGGAAMLPALVYPALMASGTIWFFFFFPATTFTAVPLLVALTFMSRVNPEALDAFLGGPGALLGAVVLIAAWSTFAVWYLGAARIGPFRSRLLSRLNGASSSRAELPDVVPYTTALRAHLWSRPRTKPAAGIAAIGVIAFGLASFIGPQEMPMIQALILVVTMLAFHSGREATYRARLLWLRSRLSRRQLFALAETGLPEQWGPSLMLFAGLAGAHALRGMALEPLLPFFVIAASTTALGGYLGLMALRPARLFDVALRIGYVASVGYAAWILFDAADADGTHDGGLLWVVGGQAAAAVVCRSIAKRHWQDIDWLVTRPPRLDPMQEVAELMQGER